MYPGLITTDSILQLCYLLRLQREYCKVKTSFLTAGLVLDQKKRTVLFNILLGLFFFLLFFDHYKQVPHESLFTFRIISQKSK